MPFKANASRHHHIPKQTRKVSNWADYNASARQHGSLRCGLVRASDLPFLQIGGILGKLPGYRRKT